MPYDRLRRTILPALARRIEVSGLQHVPPHGPFIIVANHQSYLDAPQVAFSLIMERNLKIWFLTTEHVWKFFGLFGGKRLLRWMGMIPILNSQKAQSLNPALEVLNGGGVVAVFPEGMRNTPKRNSDWQRMMIKGKTGAARLALATGAPVIPAGIIAPPGLTAFQALRNFLLKKQPAVVRFGAPMHFQKTDVSYLTKGQLVKTTNTMMREVANLCGKSYPYDEEIGRA